MLDRVRAEGNAGNQVKVTGSTAITNSVLVGNCAYFEGQPFTHNVDPCRALGNTLEVVYTGGERISIVNSTFYGQGDGLVSAGSREGYRCNGAESLVAKNNIFLGDQDFFDPGDITFLFYQETCGNLSLTGTSNMVHSAKNTGTPWVDPPFGSGNNFIQDPELAGPLAGDVYGLALSPGSPAIDAGDDAVCPPIDCLGRARPMDGDDDGRAVCDLGAYEWSPGAALCYAPLVLASD